MALKGMIFRHLKEKINVIRDFLKKTGRICTYGENSSPVLNDFFAFNGNMFRGSSMNELISLHMLL